MHQWLLVALLSKVKIVNNVNHSFLVWYYFVSLADSDTKTAKLIEAWRFFTLQCRVTVKGLSI